MTTTLRVWVSPPPGWDDLVATEPAGVTARSLALTVDRFGDGFRHLALESGDRIQVALGGTLLAAPLPGRRVDPYQILSGHSVDVGLIADGPHPWRGREVAEVFPTLLLMYPNYDTRPVGPAADDPDAVSDLLVRIREWARGHGARTVSVLYAHRSPALHKALSAIDAQTAGMSSTCVMDVRWADFAGYLDTFRAKRRIVIQRELRQLREQGIELPEEPLDRCADELVRLRCALVAKYGGNASPDKERRLIDQVLRDFAPVETCLITARLDGRLLGFLLFVREGREWTALLTGADYADERSRFTYFATAFYRAAELAPASGVRRIHFGLGSWEAKRLRGCRLEPLSAGVFDVHH